MNLRSIVEEFSNPEIKVISFDIFDTLVCRPLGRPSDLFELLDRDFSRNNESAVSFRVIRTEAEAVLRRKIISGAISREDITLDEIYEVIASDFGVSPELAMALKNKENELEITLCKPRVSGKYLYEMAKQTSAKVILTSDMYLTEDVIIKILDNVGIKDYDLLTVSSKCGKRKISGNIYSDVMAQLGVQPSEILHIGDNFESDYKIPSDMGMKAIHFPSSREVFESHGCAHQVEKICSDLTNWQAACDSVGIGIMRQMAANYYFDDPYRDFASESDYNNDPEFVGYAALGPELLALNQWIVENALRDKASKVIFLARDGYMPKKVYDLYRSFHPELPPSEYLHVSRRSVLPAMIRTATDLYQLPVDITYQTPGKLLRLLSFCVSEDVDIEAKNFWGYDADTNFNKETYQGFISAFIKNGYDKARHDAAVSRIGDYLKNNPEAQVTSDAVLFDMGYSGRIAAAIAYATGLNPVSYYFHADSREHFKFERKSDIKIRSFFDFNPYMESSLREYSYLEVAASCVGYGEGYEVLYDIGPAEGYGDTALQMQSGAMKMVQEYYETFAQYEAETSFRGHDAAMPFEAFIRYCGEYDRSMYGQVLIDDELWGGRRDINIRRLMEARLSKLPEYAKEK